MDEMLLYNEIKKTFSYFDCFDNCDNSSDSE